MSVLHTTMLLGTLTGILMVIGLLVGGVIGMAFALVFAIIINIFSYWYSDRIVLRMYGAALSDRSDLDDMVTRLAHEAKIPKPRIYIIAKEAPNAFATGRNPRHSAIAVTEGLLALDREELEGVLAHEMAHIRNRDVLVSTMAATIGGAIAFLAQIGYWSLFMGGGRRDQGNMLGLLLIIIFAPIAALLVRLAISRTEEYRADRIGALLTKNPKGLSSALRKISSYANHNPMGTGSTASSHMWIVNPFKSDWFTGLFSTHPPLHKRIEHLEEMHRG
jgi:heat shock protein HtpX